MSSDNDRPLYTRRRVIGLGAAALGATAAGRVISVYGAQGSAIESYNWSGARVTNDIPEMKYPTQQYFTSVLATWRVPTVEPNQNELDVRSAAWIGLDGGTFGLPETPSPVKVLQAGTYHEVQSGKPAQYFAFFGLDDGSANTGDLYSTAPFVRFSVKPYDRIKVVLTYPTGTPGEALADFSGSTSAPSDAKFKLPIPDKTITGYTAEWVFERISIDNNSAKKDYQKSYYNLGNHDHIDFNQAVARTDGGNSISPDQGDSIIMRDVDNWPNPLTVGTASGQVVEIKQRRL
jgi:hypothetical protein